MEPAVFWLAVLGAACIGLTYYRWSVLPALRARRTESAVKAFGRAIEYRFPKHAGLTDEVAKLAKAVGARLGFAPQRLQRLTVAARLRDIGVCAIPYRILNEREWPNWTLSELATYDCHPEIGAAILETVPALAPYADTVRNHHKPFATDGGDPQPSLEARIVNVCAEFAWYRKHVGLPAAQALVRENSGTLFDPVVAREVLACSGA